GERVDVRVAVVSAIGAVGREAFRREGEFEEIGIGVGSDPALISELKVSAADIGKKSGEFERADFEFDAGAAPLFLECGAEDASEERRVGKEGRARWAGSGW